MDAKEQEFYVNWIIADYIPFEVDGKRYHIGSPSPEDKFVAEGIYSTFYDMALDEGLLTSGDLIVLLKKYNIWNEEKEGSLVRLTKDVETIKVNIYENYTRSSSKEEWRRALHATEEQIDKYLMEKHCWDMLGVEGVAQMAKQQYLLGSSIYTASKKQYWKSEKCWELPDHMMNIITSKLAKFRLSSQEYRLLSKSNYWKSIWSVCKNGNPFGKAYIKLSDSQRNLIYWSRFYEGIYKSPDCPTDEIVEDDDAIDGWLIMQRRKREAEANRATINQLMGDDKIRESEHVFVITEEPDIEKVYEMNDISGKIALNKRLSQIKREGVVSEGAMIDTKEKIQQQCNAMFGR